jgi:hypothetical protein
MELAFSRMSISQMRRISAATFFKLGISPNFWVPIIGYPSKLLQFREIVRISAFRPANAPCANCIDRGSPEQSGAAAIIAAHWRRCLADPAIGVATPDFAFPQ